MFFCPGHEPVAPRHQLHRAGRRLLGRLHHPEVLRDRRSRAQRSGVKVKKITHKRDLNKRLNDSAE